MKIYAMTATFGKLDHATLTLEPGLNILHAPNEWGKSTWCAFLTNMLYGVDTKARANASGLPDKERYAPWSGAPMSGRMDLNWQGRDITVERRSKGRIPMGEFRAYETATGIEVPELNAANCGQMLLGVERSVFVRAGFLKLSDLPVTQDDSLRRRLNNLVTTGDESGAGDKLASRLKDLKNKCRHNQTGLLPQAERERDTLLTQIDDLYALQKQMEDIRAQQQALTGETAQLENHREVLAYTAAQEDIRRVEAAQARCQQAREALAAQEAICGKLPSRQEAEEKCQAAQALQGRWMDLQMQISALPQAPKAQDTPAHYAGLSDPAAAARQDFERQSALENGRRKWNRLLTLLLILSGGVLVGGLLAGWLLEMPMLIAAAGGFAAAAVAALLIVSAARTKTFRREMDALYDRHPGLAPGKWVEDAQSFAAGQTAWLHAQAAYTEGWETLSRQRQALEDSIAALTGGEGLSECQARWTAAAAAWDALENARREARQAQSHFDALRAMAKDVPQPQHPDALTLSAGETDTRLAANQFRQKQLQLELGQCQGKAESIGTEAMLKARLETVTRRIARLEDTYCALEMALDALREATATLQRRFAPRISKRAQELFRKLTGGRYDRITLGEDLSLNACTREEDTLRPAQWRSDGTVDQLYLALRLAVAEELTPDAPLVLDDALVRFDDERLKTALEILKESAKEKQVILFTCQGRENALL